MQSLMPPVDTPDNTFHDGNPLTGELGTIVTAAHLNNVQNAVRDTQAELIAVLTEAGLVPNSFPGQLLAALQELFVEHNDTLGALALLAGTADKFPYFTGPNSASLTDITSVARTILGKNTVADVVSYLGVGSGRLLRQPQVLLSGSGTYMPPPGMQYALVYALGAGGGSGSAPATTSSQTSASPGGASGSWALVKLTAAEIGSSQFYNIGQGGGAGVNGAGSDGGNTSFGSLIICPGGKGSPVGFAISTSSSTLNPGAAPGGAPTVTSGTIYELSNGNPGGKSMFVTSNTLAGDGGSCPKGSGGQGLGATAPASPGSGNGSGASGAANGTNAASAKNGAAGANGGIWIWEYA
ncbi:TPA: hypothetical protein QHN14_003348 [Enterobacter roggenkampii]|nr:hypothetical protein [Enterobacter roggenkampii]